MLLHKRSKLIPISDFATLSRRWLRLCLDRSRFSFALAPQVNRIATDVEQLAGFAFLETVQFNRLHHLLPEVFAVRFRHVSRAVTIGILVVYVLTLLATAINPRGGTYSANLSVAQRVKPVAYPLSYRQVIRGSSLLGFSKSVTLI